MRCQRQGRGTSQWNILFVTGFMGNVVQIMRNATISNTTGMAEERLSFSLCAIVLKCSDSECWVTVAFPLCILFFYCGRWPVTLTPVHYCAVAFLSGFVDPVFRFQGQFLSCHFLH